MRRRAPERRCQIAIADRLRDDARPGWYWTHIPAGEKRTRRTGGLLKRMGLRRGLSDLLLIDVTGRHYWLELKAIDGEITEDQHDFLGMLRNRGVPCAVARSYAQAIDQLKRWGAL